MQKEIILTPEELYYLGSFLQAKYIDYAYVAAMSDIKQNYSLFENETKAALVSSGILMEDFGGQVEIDEEISNLLKPIFFGEVETSLDICLLGEKNSVSVHKFHFYDGIITMVTGDNGKLIIRATDQLGIKNIVENLLPDNYDAISTTVDKIDENKVTRFIAAKNVFVGEKSSVKTYLEVEGIFYHETDDCIESLTKDMFILDVFDTVKGA